MRLTKSDRAVLSRIAEGWRPLQAQVPSGTRFERRGLLHLNWGPEGSPDEDKMCWYLTARGHEALTNDGS